MRRRKINIDVIAENIELAEAVQLVRLVIDQGRISGESFCYATRFPRHGVAVEATTNELDERSKWITSDSFRVVPE
jgi:hypothetical protein